MDNVIPFCRRIGRFQINDVVELQKDLMWQSGETLRAGEVCVIRKISRSYVIGRYEHIVCYDLSRLGNTIINGTAHADQLKLV